MRKTIATITALFAALAAAPSAFAQPPATRITEVEVERFGELVEVRRDRSSGKESARFEVGAMDVPEGAVMAFEVTSTSKKGDIERMICMAQFDTRECFDRAQSFMYLPGDEAIVLTVTLFEPHDPQVVEYFAEHRPYFARR